jgi:hypothetical protein
MPVGGDKPSARTKTSWRGVARRLPVPCWGKAARPRASLLVPGTLGQGARVGPVPLPAGTSVSVPRFRPRNGYRGRAEGGGRCRQHVLRGHQPPQPDCSRHSLRRPQPPGGGGGLQVANSDTDFKPNQRHNSGEGDTLLPPLAERQTQQPAHAKETFMTRRIVLRVAGLLQCLVRQSYFVQNTFDSNAMMPVLRK